MRCRGCQLTADISLSGDYMRLGSSDDNEAGVQTSVLTLWLSNTFFLREKKFINYARLFGAHAHVSTCEDCMHSLCKTSNYKLIKLSKNFLHRLHIFSSRLAMKIAFLFLFFDFVV